MGPWLLNLTAAVARRMPVRARLALYRLGPLTRGLRRALNLAAPHGVRAVRVASGPLAGTWLLLDLQVDKDLWLGNYEPDLAREILRLTTPGSVAYDLGANVGYTTFLLARGVGPTGRVIAFEPLPENVARLGEAIALNGMADRIEVVAAAVGEASGPRQFLVHASGAMGRLRSPSGPDGGSERSIEVETVSLDGYVFEQGHPAPSLVKVDLEGGEGSALRGMERVLREIRPILAVEIHGPQARQEVDTVLRRAGYLVEPLRPGGAATGSGRPPVHILAFPPGTAA